MGTGSLDERLVHEIVQKVMANLQIDGNTEGMHGVFTDMNEAIEAAYVSQKKVHAMTGSAGEDNLGDTAQDK